MGFERKFMQHPELSKKFCFFISDPSKLQNIDKRLHLWLWWSQWLHSGGSRASFWEGGGRKILKFLKLLNFFLFARAPKHLPKFSMGGRGEKLKNIPNWLFFCPHIQKYSFTFFFQFWREWNFSFPLGSTTYNKWFWKKISGENPVICLCEWSRWQISDGMEIS